MTTLVSSNKTHDLGCLTQANRKDSGSLQITGPATCIKAAALFLNTNGVTGVYFNPMGSDDISYNDYIVEGIDEAPSITLFNS